MKLIEAIENIEQINEDAFFYVKRINGNFSIASEVKILELTEEEIEWKTYEVTERKCPGFEYFMESFLIKEFVESLDQGQYPTLEEKCTRLIHYAEFDA
tara:strand:+ start:337 stop:633 length:297 start_codon:yes stop_codon:yes gene_type:complete